jgi:hypothetical protein
MPDLVEARRVIPTRMTRNRDPVRIDLIADLRTDRACAESKSGRDLLLNLSDFPAIQCPMGRIKCLPI